MKIHFLVIKDSWLHHYDLILNQCIYGLAGVLRHVWWNSFIYQNANTTSEARIFSGGKCFLVPEMSSAHGSAVYENKDFVELLKTVTELLPSKL